MSWKDEEEFLKKAAQPPELPTFCFGQGQYVEKYLRELEQDIDGLSTGWCYALEKGQMMRGIPPELHPESIGKCHARVLQNLDALESVVNRIGPCIEPQDQLRIAGQLERLRISVEEGKKSARLFSEFRELADALGGYKIFGLFRMIEARTVEEGVAALEGILEEAMEKSKAQTEMEEEYK